MTLVERSLLPVEWPSHGRAARLWPRLRHTRNSAWPATICDNAHHCSKRRQALRRHDPTRHETSEVTLVEERPVSAAQAAARKAMIDSQLRTSGINAPYVIERMGAVAREDFVPASARGIAYIDRAIDLGNGSWLAAPLVQGLMLQEARPMPADGALLVDGGSGYLAELLRPLVGSLEVIAPAEAVGPARKKGAATLLLIDGAIEQWPVALTQRLAEGGRVVCGVLQGGLTRLAAGRKAAGQVALLPLAEIGIPVLPQFAARKEWSF